MIEGRIDVDAPAVAQLVGGAPGLAEAECSPQQGVEITAALAKRMRDNYHLTAHRTDGSFRLRGDGLELQLFAAGFIAYSRTVEGLNFLANAQFTERGMAWLVQNYLRNRNRRGGHERFIDRVAAYVRAMDRVVWKNIELQSQQDPQRLAGIGVFGAMPVARYNVRPDLYSVASVLDPRRASPVVHEIKVGRADLLADIADPQKRLGYFTIAERVYYVCPDGVAGKPDIPPECGLIVFQSERFREVKRARRIPIQLASRTYMTLLAKYQGRPDADDGT